MDGAALQDSLWREAELHGLLVDAQEDLDIGVVVTEGFRVVWANAAFARIVGRSPEELTSRDFDFRQLRPDEEGDPGQGRFTQLDDEAPKRRFEARLRRKDGALRVVEGASKSVDLSGRPLRVSMVRDVTDQRRSQRALVESTKAFAKAEKLGSLSALLAALSHEVRTPLTLIQTSASLLDARLAARADDGLRDSLAPHLKTLQEGVDRANAIVADLTALADDWPDGEKHPASLHVVAEEALRVWRMAGRAYVVETDLRPTPPVLVNRTQLHQVLIHLLRNAREACEPDDVRVRLRTRTTSDGRAMLVVEDEGCGIPPEAQPHVFEPLFTTHDDRLGLGLTIVEAIVKEHDGAIRCASTPGEGSRFTLTFPAHAPDAAPPGGKL